MTARNDPPFNSDDIVTNLRAVAPDNDLYDRASLAGYIEWAADEIVRLRHLVMYHTELAAQQEF